MKILDNGVAVIEGDTHHAVWCASEGLIHDGFTAMILRNLIRDNRVKSAVDGGANIGTLTKVMLDEGIRVHAFEPNPQAVECLRHNCPGAMIYQCGLSSLAEKRLLIREANAGASFIARHSSASVADELVQLMPLDTYTIKPGLIKLDVEGFEVDALRGGEKMIRRYRPIIVCEVNEGALQRAGQSKERLYETLSDLGYSTAIMQPDCRMNSPQYDVIAIPC